MEDFTYMGMSLNFSVDGWQFSVNSQALWAGPVVYPVVPAEPEPMDLVLVGSALRGNERAEVRIAMKLSPRDPNILYVYAITLRGRPHLAPGVTLYSAEAGDHLLSSLGAAPIVFAGGHFEDVSAWVIRRAARILNGDPMMLSQVRAFALRRSQQGSIRVPEADSPPPASVGRVRCFSLVIEAQQAQQKRCGAH